MRSPLIPVTLVLLAGLMYSVTQAGAPDEKPTMYDKLLTTVNARVGEFGDIPTQRRIELQSLADAINASQKASASASLVFICTHNSRRSHMAQIWAAVAAHHYGIENIHTYSGGTESTAFNPRAVAAMQRAGFRIEKTTDDANPIYHVRYSDNARPLTCFSKVYDGAPNPKEGFIAVMTCDHANEACPLVKGASKRVAITYEDPKVADGTPAEAAKYDERCRQIGREMLYVFSLLK